VVSAAPTRPQGRIAVQLVDAGMIAFAAYHALKGRVEWPLTF
jgi:hypothetical protein